MNFVSGLFVAFLLVTLALFYTVPARLRMPVLLAMSYLFYASWNIPFISILLLTTTFDYWMSRIIHESASPSKRKWALVSGLTVNLLVLAFFKYCNFFLSTTHSIAGWFGAHPALPRAFEVILPLGISFYTFEAISYMVDVYRGKKPSDSWLNYNFYIMYFPHLISGPIVRFGELFSQYKNGLALPAVARVAKGAELIMLGYVFKILVADNAVKFVDPVFASPATASVMATYLAVIGFTVQIYFDFMGYTHIARGVSLLFNIELPLNFNHPYHATTVSDFWKRWHISLSRWIQDYLYFPLGGSRGTMMQTVMNLMVTMTICGAWHGAGWTFIIWGAWHGLWLAVYHVYKHSKAKLPLVSTLDGTPAYSFFAQALTFVLVVTGWVIFRSPDFATMTAVLKQLANIPAFLSETAHAVTTGHLTDPLALLALLSVCFVGPVAVRTLESVYYRMPFAFKVQLATWLALFCWLMTDQTTPFIYFQF